MRRIVTSREVYHLWAHQAQSEARNSSGSVSFNGNRAYSYSALIGQIVTAPNGERVYLISDTRYSVTTAGHQSMLRSSIRGSENTFVAEYATRYEFDTAEFLKAMLSVIPDLALKAKRARKYGDRYQAQIANTISQANRFATLFNLPEPELSPDLDKIVEQMEAIEREQRRLERERQAQREAALKGDLNRWIAGESVNSSLWSLSHAYMRVQGDEVITTKGARVPIEHVKKIVPLVLGYIHSGKTYLRNGHSIHLGHYTLDEIDRFGQLHVGCHLFSKEEIIRFADVLASLPTEQGSIAA